MFDCLVINGNWTGSIKEIRIPKKSYLFRGGDDGSELCSWLLSLTCLCDSENKWKNTLKILVFWVRMLGINTSKMLMLKVIHELKMFLYCHSFFPLPAPPHQTVLTFCFDKILLFVLHQICCQFQLCLQRYWQFLWEVCEVNKKWNASHMLKSLDSPRIYKKHVSNIEW